MSQVYDFTLTSLQGKQVVLSEFKGKVLLLVNTASECGFTPQYQGLQKLHQRYKDRGLVVIGFPCNQFGQQEAGDAESISQGCLSHYSVDFLISEKVDVNGSMSHPLFNYLRQHLPGVFGNKIKWNFTKFLIGRDGEPLYRFAPITKPNKLEKFVQQALESK
jgi:glutathione peroxidase